MEVRVRVAIVLLVLGAFCCEGISSSDLHPVVLVPGIIASTIEARVTEDAEPPINTTCSAKGHDWFTLWMDFLFIVFRKQCFLDSIKLHYDADLDDYRNAVGLETRVPGFGSPINATLGDAMAELVESLREIGYEDGVNLFGAPYDFRYGLAAEGHPSSIGSQFLQDLKELIENASASNGGKPVILLSHSLGGLFSLQCLIRNALSWRQQYIKHFIPIATPWGGTVTTMAIFGSGVNLSGLESFINYTELRDIGRGMESILWLMPNPGPFAFSANTTLVVTPTANYTAYDVSQFIQDTTGLPDAALPYESRILPLVENLTAPEVPVTLIAGTNLPTAEILIYNETGFDQPPEIVYGDGDQLVNLASALRIQSEWAQNENQPTPTIITLPGIGHEAIVNDDEAINVIIEQISLINGNSTESPALSVWTGKANA